MEVLVEFSLMLWLKNINVIKGFKIVQSQSGDNFCFFLYYFYYSKCLITGIIFLG